MDCVLKDLPADLEAELRARAERENKSPDQVAVEALSSLFGLFRSDPPKRDLRFLVGSWTHDEDVERALEAQRRVDLDLWS